VGLRYLLVHLFGGSLLLAGILGQVQTTGGIALQLLEAGRLSSWLILGGIAVNAAIPPLHAWLSDAYPRATVTGAVFLSAFTTKSAVYLLARVAPGWEILIALGVIMALYGVIFAVLANNIREILAYHIISQVGYMVAGVGIGTPLALNGAVAHAFSHILYKALLFMGAGMVLHATGRSRLTELGGLAGKMPLTLWLYMVGAFSISGFPLFNGFISKSMVVSAALDARYQATYLLLVLASVGTFLSIGLKLPTSPGSAAALESRECRALPLTCTWLWGCWPCFVSASESFPRCCTPSCPTVPATAPIPSLTWWRAFNCSPQPFSVSGGSARGWPASRR